MLPLLLLAACGPRDTKEDRQPYELCNGIDDDGDGEIDEGQLGTWYPDDDGDGYGRDEDPVWACERPAHYAERPGDCDDTDPAANPGEVETCATPGDDDCDGLANPENAPDCVETWVDADGDGWGDGGESACTCDGDGRAAQDGDCDPTDADRGADCTVGDEVPLVGARLLDDDPDTAWILSPPADLDGDGTVEAVFAADAGLRVAALPMRGGGDTLLSAATRAVLPVPAGVARALADLDGDGFPELLQASIAVEADPDDPYAPTSLVTPTVSAWSGPLLSGLGAPTAVALPTVRTSAVLASLFVADLDGAGVPAAWYASGTTEADPGEAGFWRVPFDGGEAVPVALTDEQGAFAEVLAGGDLDGDGVGDLVSVTLRAPVYGVSVYAGPLDDGLPAATQVDTTEEPYGVVPVGDLTGDGYDDLAVRGAHVWILAGPVAAGALPDVALARIGAESDDLSQSSLFVAAGDVAWDDGGPDGAPDLVVTDAYWAGLSGAQALHGALYAFDAVPTGVVDVRSATVRSYGGAYGALGAVPAVLPDGRVLVGAHVETTDVGQGAFLAWEP